MDTPLAEAEPEPIRDGGSDSGDNISKGIKLYNFSQRKEREYVRATMLLTPRSVQKERQEVLWVPEQIPLQPVVRTMGIAVPLQLWRSRVEQSSTCSL